MEIHAKRKRLRLHGFDYSKEGFYFLTICTQNRKCLFGEIVGANLCVRPNNLCSRPDNPGPSMIPNDAGTMVDHVWNELPNRFPNIELDRYVVMPNHFHGIISVMYGGPTHRSAPTIGRMVQWFKTITTNYYIHGVKQHGWPTFEGRLWQRNYYEHIIRNDRELSEIHQYVIDNPLKWYLDPENVG